MEFVREHIYWFMHIMIIFRLIVATFYTNIIMNILMISKFEVLRIVFV